MGRKVLANSPFYSVIAVTALFMLLNAFLPLNLSATAEATEHPFKLIISMKKTTYKLGETVPAKLILENIGAENIIIYHSIDGVTFNVYDESFDRVYSPGLRSLAVVYPLKPIPPGGNRTYGKSWKQIHGGSGYVMPELWLKQVPPGTYYVTGILYSPTYNVTVMTPAIRISILGA